MPKTTKKRTISPKKSDIQQQTDKILLEIKKFTNTANKKYQSLDNDTKKKLVTGVGLLAAFVAGGLLLKKKKKK